MNDQSNCRIAVYDADTGKFLGFKADTSWGLSETAFGQYPKGNTGLDGKLMADLLFDLDQRGPPPGRMRLEAESVPGAGEDQTVIQHI
jgi:hypothetical protein